MLLNLYCLIKYIICIWIDIQPMQQNKGGKRINNCWMGVVKSSNCLSDQDGDYGQGYRLLQNYFGKCIKDYGKNHRQCLGQIQVLYFGKLTKEQIQLVQDNKQKYVVKYIDRLRKEMLNRNNGIYKERFSYQQEFKLKFLHQQEIEKSSETTPLDTINNLIYTMEPSLKKYLSKTSARPLSSTIFRNRLFSPGSSFSNIRPKTNCFDRSVHTHRQKIKNQEQQDLVPKQSFLFENETVYIHERRKVYFNSEGQGFHQSNYPRVTQNPSITRETKMKMIEKKEKQQIQTKILLVNSTLAVNITMSQGYKPRSQCWRKTTY